MEKNNNNKTARKDERLKYSLIVSVKKCFIDKKKKQQQQQATGECLEKKSRLITFTTNTYYVANIVCMHYVVGGRQPSGFSM